jgi:hypothetical protein
VLFKRLPESQKTTREDVVVIVLTFDVGLGADGQLGSLGPDTRLIDGTSWADAFPGSSHHYSTTIFCSIVYGPNDPPATGYHPEGIVRHALWIWEKRDIPFVSRLSNSVPSQLQRHPVPSTFSLPDDLRCRNGIQYTRTRRNLSHLRHSNPIPLG